MYYIVDPFSYESNIRFFLSANAKQVRDAVNCYNGSV